MTSEDAKISRRFALLTALVGLPAIVTSTPADAFEFLPPALRNIRDSAKEKLGEAPAPAAEAPAPARPAFSMPKFGPTRKAKKAAEAAPAVEAEAKAAPAPAPAAPVRQARRKAKADDGIPSPSLDLGKLKPDFSAIEPKVKRQAVAGATGKERFDTDETLRLEERLKRRSSRVEEQAEKLKAQGAEPAESFLKK